MLRLPRLCCCPALLRLWLAAVAVCGGAARTHAAQDGTAVLVVDLKSGATLGSEHPEVIGRSVLPGSVMKIATVAAALESGAIGERTTVLCTRTVVINGHQLTCTHPDLHRPLTAAEALTHSCNVFVASVAARIPRDRFDRARASLGLPPSGTADLRAAALGLEGPRITPRTLIDAVARVARTDTSLAWKPSTLEVIRRGLRGAATVGTAAALRDAGIDALAKTGTVDAGGISQGLVVGVTPPVDPVRGFAVLVSGAAGRDAAAVAAERLKTIGARTTGAAPAGLRTDLSASPHGPPEGGHYGRGSGTQADTRGGRLPADRPAVAPAATRRLRVGVLQHDGRVVPREMVLDDYVAGVIAGEQATGSRPEALDALAIVARTYALKNAGRHAGDGFDLCDLTHCQVLRPSTAGTRAAAARTASQYLSGGSGPADVFYTASCGGFTEKPSNVWRGARDASHLPSRPDDACGGEPAWQSDIAARDLLRVLQQAGFKGDALRGLRVTRRTESGRTAWLALDGLTPSEISGENLRTLVGRTLGWQQLRSTLFDVTRTGAGYRFSGKGAGHGVGLCVLGAAARATRGADARAILRDYFPGLVVTTLEDAQIRQPLPQIRWQLPVEDRAGYVELQRLATAWLGDTATRIASVGSVVPSWPELVTVRVHPTVESYQRQTGAPWYTTATTTRDTIDLIPLDALQQRGLLESTLRHEFVHVLTFDALRRAPRWVSEGFAELVIERAGRAGGAGGAAQSGTAAGKAGAAGAACPADAEFRAATSGEALRGLYARAAACVERELRTGRPWTELGARR
ncbi:MAG: SpoIID/LytB domain-containing protein [Vicinamibacterales bacterium]